MSIKASAEQTAGTLAIVEYTAPAESPGPPLHVHPGKDEAWFVLEGELTMHIGEEQTTLPSGGFAFTPGDVPHTFSNRTKTLSGSCSSVRQADSKATSVRWPT